MSSVYWIVCLVCCGTALYPARVTGSSISLNRHARYEEVGQTEFDCSGKASGYFVHPTICSAYYACVNGKAYKSECLPGLLYHQTTTYCEKAELVDCSRSTTVAMTTGAMTTMTSATGSTMASTMQPAMSSTTQAPVTMTSTTQSTAMTTTTSSTMASTTMMMSSSTKMTTKMSTPTTSPVPITTTVPTTTMKITTPTTMKMTTAVPKTTAHGKKDDCKHHPLGTLIRNPDDCNTYFECLADGPLLLHCAPFTVFNQKYKVCDFKYHVPECNV